MEKVKMNKSKIDLIQKYKDVLANGILRLMFEKKDGSVRYAKITRNPDAVVNYGVPSGAGNRHTEYVVAFDVDHNHWIQFDPDYVTDIYGMEPLTPCYQDMEE
jgi:hypothetical protein